MQIYIPDGDFSFTFPPESEFLAAIAKLVKPIPLERRNDWGCYCQLPTGAWVNIAPLFGVIMMAHPQYGGAVLSMIPGGNYPTRTVIDTGGVSCVVSTVFRGIFYVGLILQRRTAGFITPESVRDLDALEKLLGDEYACLTYNAIRGHFTIKDGRIVEGAEAAAKREAREEAGLGHEGWRVIHKGNSQFGYTATSIYTMGLHLPSTMFISEDDFLIPNFGRLYENPAGENEGIFSGLRLLPWYKWSTMEDNPLRDLYSAGCIFVYMSQLATEGKLHLIPQF